MRRAAFALLVGALVAALAAPAAGAIDLPRVSGRAAAVFDTRSGELLYGLRADDRLAPASLAKMVTALLVAEHFAPNDTAKISHAAAFAEPDAVRWPEGRTFRVDDLVHGMLLESSNGAAVALAERVAGSASAFVRLMNAKALALGAESTRFVTPNGLDAPGQYSTARDLARITAAVLRRPWLATVVATHTHLVRWIDGRFIVFHNRNRLLYRYRGAVGVKNGYTTEAGNAVAGAALRGGVTLIAVVLKGPAVYDDAAKLLDWGFAAAPRIDPPGAGAAVVAPSPARLRGDPARGPGAGWVMLQFLTLAYVGRVVWVQRRIARRRARTAKAEARAARNRVARPRTVVALPERQRARQM